SFAWLGSRVAPPAIAEGFRAEVELAAEEALLVRGAVAPAAVEAQLEVEEAPAPAAVSDRVGASPQGAALDRGAAARTQAWEPGGVVATMAMQAAEAAARRVPREAAELVEAEVLQERLVLRVAVVPREVAAQRGAAEPVEAEALQERLVLREAVVLR